MSVASGFDFEPLPAGNVLVEFFGDDGTTINQHIVTAEAVCRMPLVAALLDVAMRMGPEVAREIVEEWRYERKRQADRGDRLRIGQLPR